MMSSHNKMNDGSKKGDFLGQKMLILGQYMMNMVQTGSLFWDKRS